MPQTSSATKHLRVSARKRAVNDVWRDKLHDSVREVKDAIVSKNAAVAREAFLKAQSVIDRAARHHIIKPNAAARRKSRLLAAISKLA